MTEPGGPYGNGAHHEPPQYPQYAQYPSPPPEQPQEPYGYGYGYGYPQQGYGYPPPPGVNGLAIAALVLGIVWIYWIGSLLAVIFGHIALSQTTRTGQQGKGMAIAGLVLGWIGLGLLALVIIIAIAEPDAYDSMRAFL